MLPTLHKAQPPTTGPALPHYPTTALTGRPLHTCPDRLRPRQELSMITVPTYRRQARSIVLATIQAPQDGIHIQGATPAAGSFTITLSGKATGDIAIGWFIIG